MKNRKAKSKLRKAFEIVDSPSFLIGFLAAVGLFMGLWLIGSLFALVILVLDENFFEIVLPIYVVFFLLVHYYFKSESLDKNNYANLAFLLTSIFLLLLFSIEVLLVHLK